MRDWSPHQVAEAAGARLLSGAGAWSGPEQVTIDSRQAAPGVLFVGLPGEKVDGGSFARDALAAGAWGVIASPEHGRHVDACRTAGAWLEAEDPLQALQRLATAWRRALGAQVIGVTGSTGKTSTKEILRALLAPHRRVVASRANFNTEIGLPLELLSAPEGTEVVVLEMGMRGPGQIAELAGIAEPDVAVIVSIGPVHVELLGGVEQIAAAKAELIAGLAPGATAVVPADEPLLAPHLRDDVVTVRFGPAGDVQQVAEDAGTVTIEAGGETLTLDVPFRQPHLRRNLLAAVAAARAVGVTPSGRVGYTPGAGRGERVELPGAVTLIDDSYNANPMSMAAALIELQREKMAVRRTVAVLGDMLELGPDEREYHIELGRQASELGVQMIIAVGPLAAAIGDRYDGEFHTVGDAEAATALLRAELLPGDVVLLKASNGVGLTRVRKALLTAEDDGLSALADAAALQISEQGDAGE